MTDMQDHHLSNLAFIRPCPGNRNQFLIPKYLPRAPLKFQLPHAICGSGVLIFGGRGGILRTIAGARPYKSRIHQHFKLHFGLELNYFWRSGCPRSYWWSTPLFCWKTVLVPVNLWSLFSCYLLLTATMQHCSCSYSKILNFCLHINIRTHKIS